MTIILPNISLTYSLLTAKCINLSFFRDGPLEKLWGGGGGGNFFSFNFPLRDFFFVLRPPPPPPPISFLMVRPSIDHNRYFKEVIQILPLSIQSGVRLIEVFNNRN